MFDALLPLHDVIARVNLSRQTIYRWVKEGRFPRPRELSPRCVRWPESEITAWIAALPITAVTKGAPIKKTP